MSSNVDKAPASTQCASCGSDVSAAPKKPHFVFRVALDPSTPPDHAAPVREVAEFAPPFSLRAAGTHCVALDGQGQLFTWGQATFGQLGLGKDMTGLELPTLVDLNSLCERQRSDGSVPPKMTGPPPPDSGRRFVEGAFAGPAQTAVAVRVVGEGVQTCSASCAAAASAGESTVHVYAAGMLNGQSDVLERLYALHLVLDAAGIGYQPEEIKILDMTFSSSCCVFAVALSAEECAVFSFGSSPKGHLALGMATNFVQDPQHLVSLRHERVLSVHSSQHTFAARTAAGKVFVWGEVYQDSASVMTPIFEPTLVRCNSIIATVRVGQGFVLMLNDGHDVLQFGCCGPYADTVAFMANEAVEVLRKKRIAAIAARERTALALSGSSSSKAYLWGEGPLVKWQLKGHAHDKYIGIPSSCFSSALGSMRVQDMYLSDKWEMIVQGVMKRTKRAADARGNSPCVRSRTDEVRKEMSSGIRSRSFENLNDLREADAKGRRLGSSGLAQSASTGVRAHGRCSDDGYQSDEAASSSERALGGTKSASPRLPASGDAVCAVEEYRKSLPAVLERSAELNKTKVVEWGSPNPLDECHALSIHRVHKISCAGVHCAAITVNGRAYTWGRGSCGELGHGLDIKATYKPTRVASLASERVRDVRCGPSQTAFITRTETLLVTGLMCNTNYWAPQEIDLALTAEQNTIVSVNMSASVLYCVIKDEYGVRLLVLGDSSKGMLGLGINVMCTQKPQEVPFKPEFVPKDMATGDHHVALLGECGKIYEWGETSVGLPTKGANLRTVWEPRHVRLPQGAGKVVHIACGRRVTFALTDAGELYSWGFNKNGVLGIGWNDPDQGMEPQVIPTLADYRVVGVHCGGRFTAAWAADGKAWMWGRGNEGCLGSSNKSDAAIPRPLVIPRATRLAEIKCGYERCVALMYEDPGEAAASGAAKAEDEKSVSTPTVPTRSVSSGAAARPRRLSIRAGFMASSMGVVRSRRSSQSLSKETLLHSSSGTLPVLPAGGSAKLMHTKLSRSDESTPIRRETDMKGVMEVVRTPLKVPAPQQLQCVLAKARKISLPKPVLSYMSEEYLLARDVVRTSKAPSGNAREPDLSLRSPKMDSASDSLLEWLRETVFSARDTCVLIFFRGSWCPFDRTYLQAWSEIADKAEECNGLLLGVSTQDTVVTASLASQWGLQFPLLSDLYLELTREFGITQGRVKNPLQQKNYAGSAGIMCQPAIVVLHQGKTVYTWTAVPQGGNLQGASNRPAPRSVWAALENINDKSHDFYKASLNFPLEFRSAPSAGSEQAQLSCNAAIQALQNDLDRFKGDLASLWSWVKSSCRFAVLVYFPGMWHQASALWLKRWSAVACELELAGCVLYAATTETQEEANEIRLKLGLALPVVGMGSSLSLAQAHSMKISKRKGSPTGAIQPGLIIMNTVGDFVYQYICTSSLLSSSTTLPDPLDIWKSLQMVIEEKMSKVYDRKKQKKSAQMHAAAKISMIAPSPTEAYTCPQTDAEKRASKLLSL